MGTRRIDTKFVGSVYGESDYNLWRYSWWDPFILGAVVGISTVIFL